MRRRPGAVVRIEVVHLVQDEEQPGQLAMRQLEEFHLDLGDRRVRRDHKERRIALRQEIDRRLSSSFALFLGSK